MAARFSRWLVATSFLCCSLFFLGCGPGKVTMQGKVSVKGKPIQSGSIMIECSDGNIVTGTIDQGKYSVPDVLAGSIKIAVNDIPPPTADPNAEKSEKNRIPAGMARGGGPAQKGGGGGAAAAGSKSLVPPEYQSPTTTPIKHDTNSGTTKDIDIP